MENSFRKILIPAGSQFSPSFISLYPVAQEHFAPTVAFVSQKCMQSPLFTSHLFAIAEEKKNKNIINSNPSSYYTLYYI